MRKSVRLFVIVASVIFVFTLPVNATASSSYPTYSPSRVRISLQKNIERHYYTFKDRPIKKPEHTVSHVRVLYSTQHDQTIILVGSCLIDGKEHIITGTLAKDKAGELAFGGGWTETTNIAKPLYYGMGGDVRGVYVSGISMDKSITHVRFIPMDDDQPVSLLIHQNGCFAGYVPTPNRPEHPKTLRFFVEGLNTDGNVVYSSSQRPGKQNKFNNAVK